MYPVGTNVLNDRTMGESARGLADTSSLAKGRSAALSCVIARDTRHNSPEFAELCARVLAAAGFKVYLFAEPRSTPLLSFAVRHLGCDAGIMITASHNPPSDNGFKCYAPTGGQVIPPDDAGIIACVKAASDREIPEKPFEEGLADGSIVLVGAGGRRGLHRRRRRRVGQRRARPVDRLHADARRGRDLGGRGAPGRAGFDAAQHPRLATDPGRRLPQRARARLQPRDPQDARRRDRARPRPPAPTSSWPATPTPTGIGVGVPVTGDPKGEWTTLDGNQIGVAAGGLRHEEDARRREAPPRPLPGHDAGHEPDGPGPGRARTGSACEDDLLVGFKWIGQRIDEAGPAGLPLRLRGVARLPEGDPRPRQGRGGRRLALRRAGRRPSRPRGRPSWSTWTTSIIDVGHYGERLINKTFEGREGADQIKTLMAAFRPNPPGDVGGLAVTEVYDYNDPRDPRRRRPAGPAGPCPSPRATSSSSTPRRRGMPVRRPAVGDRAEDQVLPVRPDRHRGRDGPLGRQGDDRASA